MSEHTASVENIIYGSYVKHNRLEKIVYETFSNTSIAAATELNIFVDVYSVLHSIFSEHFRTQFNEYSEITSGIINLVAHYRDFFSRLSVKTNFYLIFSFNTCELNRKFVAGYNETFYNKSNIQMFKEMATYNFELLNILCPYLPDVHFVKSVQNYESSVIISHIIDILNDGLPNLIISKDIYPIQLCALHPYTSYLKPIKTFEGDCSIMIPINEKPNFREAFWSAISQVRKIPLEQFMPISPLNFPLLMAMHKFPERDLNKINCTIKTAVKIITDITQSEDIKLVPSQLYTYPDAVNKLPIAKVEAIANVLDVQFLKVYYQMEPESKSLKFQNLSDPVALQHINSKFFTNNPLDFNKL